jgi:hypothetical protein
MFASQEAMPQCSRAGCNNEASYSLIWSNPKIHTDGRTKTWLACNEHIDYLTEYLESRGLLKNVMVY